MLISVTLAAVFGWISCAFLAFHSQRYHRRAVKAESELARRPHSVELDDFLHELALHGKGVLQISALRINEILLRARPERYDD